MAASQSALCRIDVDSDRQPKCGGCRRIEALIRYRNNRDTTDEPPLPWTRPLLVHDNFAQLDQCAKRCLTCRVIRRAILLDQPTVGHASRLGALGVWAALSRDHKLAVAASSQPLDPTDPGTVTISLSRNPSAAALAAALVFRPNHDAVYSQARQWARLCHSEHPDCDNLAWSTKSPTRLLRIHPNALTVQLVTVADFVPYMALSYCWGPPTNKNDNNGGTHDGRTLTSNLSRRTSRPFPASDFPPTIRDAIALARGVSLSYLWVDSACIVQDDPADWSREAALMHQVYANAHFTLAASSVDRAAHPGGLFAPREAWRYPCSEPCLLNGRVLSVDYRTRLAAAATRDRSVWAGRAWTLQEEVLSPRILYWTPHGIYWSCGRENRVEGPPPPPSQIRSSSGGRSAAAAVGDHHYGLAMFRRESQRWGFEAAAASDRGDDEAATASSRAHAEITAGAAASPSTTTTTTQDFLLASWSGTGLHDRWLDVVESYSRRDLTNPTDRFPAISGLSARYQHRKPGDCYVAGLWYETFARDLAWSVVVAVGVREEKGDDGDDDDVRTAEMAVAAVRRSPSWSWAVLPPRTAIRMWRGETTTGDGSLRVARPTVTTSHTKSSAADGQIPYEHPQQDEAGDSDDVADKVRRGSQIRSIRVSGRMRRLCHSSGSGGGSTTSPPSIPVPWEAVCLSSTRPDTAVVDSLVFSFRDVVEVAVHSVDLERGRVVAYEPHRAEAVGQLDFLRYADGVYADPEAVWCLEVAADVTLLLAEVEGEEGTESDEEDLNRDKSRVFQRVGIATRFRSDFYAACSEEWITML